MWTITKKYIFGNTELQCYENGNEQFYSENKFVFLVMQQVRTLQIIFKDVLYTLMRKNDLVNN